MNIHQITIITMAVVLTALSPEVVADPGNKGNADKSAHEQRNDKTGNHQDTDSHKQSWGDNDHHNYDDRDRSEHRDNDGWRSADYRNENSNRQSDPDSTRGQERAAERHSKNADKHDRPYREPRWYDFIFGEDRVKADEDRIDDMAEKKPRWWWPFN